MKLVSVALLFSTLFTQSVFGLTRRELAACVDSKVQSRRKYSAHNASADRLNSNGSATTQSFEGGGEYATMAQLECLGVKISGKLNQQAVFDSSSAMAGARIILSHLSPDTKLKYIDIVHDTNTIEYFPSEDSYRINLSDFNGEYIDGSVAAETNPSNNVMAKIHKASVSVKGMELEGDQLTNLNRAFEANAFFSKAAE
jgi:hypothetical protein